MVSARWFLLFAAASVSLYGADDSLEARFSTSVRPFVEQNCLACHSGESPAAQFALDIYPSYETVVEGHAHWAQVLGRLKAGDMPPPNMPQPGAGERRDVIEWITAVRREEARRNAGDPGVVLARRLSNAEYDYTIRDLTGVDLRPAREFPVDPANLDGFANSGESLTMSPSLLTKYLQAARRVAEHLVLTPDGIAFAPHPMLVETDREKFAIRRIVDFYERQPTDLAEYFVTAWRYKHRGALGLEVRSLSDAAARDRVSAKYLPHVWRMLEGEVAENVGPIAELRRMWTAMPAPGTGAADLAETQAATMAAWVRRIRRLTGRQYSAPVVDGLTPWSQPLINWKYAQYAAHRREFEPSALRGAGEPAPELPEFPPYPGLGREAAPRWAALIARERAGEPLLVVPDGEWKRYEAAYSDFSSVFPDGFYVSERGRFFPDDSADKGRYLSAGYHNVVGYFRDDTALRELVLDEAAAAELDRLWDEFEFIGDQTGRTWDQYYFNQSGEVRGRGRESGMARPEGLDLRDSPVIFALRDEYLALARAHPENDPIAEDAILAHFQTTDTALRRVEQMRVEAEPKHLRALVEFAERAYRRPLSDAERNDIVGYYRRLRSESELSHEEAIRDSVVSILMAPDFCYRLDLTEGFSGGAATDGEWAPLSAYGLASRLSYFLWSSMPDAELFAQAKSGALLDRAVLLEQAQRMLGDARARGLATEFGGNWLEFRHFEDYNSVDRARFPAFDDQLRTAMFEEPVRLLTAGIRGDESVLDWVYGDSTFVNPALARHYGIAEVDGDERAWVRVDGLERVGRGGLLPMAVFLTQNAPGLRTSPVKRGYWVVRRLLGEEIPPPPPTVPELPEDEAETDLPLRDVLAQHRANPACAACHARFDSFGLAFEGFGPVGEARGYDLAGRVVDILAEFPGGTEGEGVRGVKDYIRAHREQDYLDNLSRKLLAYALSRSLQLSDEQIVERAREALREEEYRFGALVETIVTSPQFLHLRRSDRADVARVARRN